MAGRKVQAMARCFRQPCKGVAWVVAGGTVEGGREAGRQNSREGGRGVG